MVNTINKLAQSCPHCGKGIDPLRAPAVTVIGGQIVHFCSPDCREHHLQRTPENGIPQEVADALEPETPATTTESDISELAEDGAETPRKPKTVSSPARTTSPLITLQLRKVAALAILFLATAFVPLLWTIWLPVFVAAVGIILITALVTIRERRFGSSRILEIFTPSLAAAIILTCSFLGMNPRLAAMAASALLLVQGFGQLLELLGRRRSGVLASIEGVHPLTVSSSWRDNSVIAAKIRKAALVLEWVRYPTGALIGLWVFFLYNHSLSEALLASATALIALSPRTLRMTTGDAHLAAALAALERGASIRDAHVIDQIASSRIVLYLTARALVEKRFLVVDWTALEGADEKTVLSALGTVEAKADGPMAMAIREFVESMGGAIAPMDDVEVREGLGVIGDTTFGRTVCGSRQLLLAEEIGTANLEPQAKAIEASGRRAIFLAVDGKAVAVFGVEEIPVKDAQSTNHQLKSIGMEPVMLTTAEADAAQALGMRLGIEHVRFETPENTLGTVLTAIRESGDNALLVGHGTAFEEHIRGAAAALAIGGDAPTQAGVNAQGKDCEFIPWMVKTAQRTKRSIEINTAATTATMIIGLALSLGWFSPLIVIFVAALSFGTAALSTLNGPYPLFERLFVRLDTMTKKIKKFSFRKAAAPH